MEKYELGIWRKYERRSGFEQLARDLSSLPPNHMVKGLGLQMVESLLVEGKIDSAMVDDILREIDRLLLIDILDDSHLAS